ncbi:MAG TPA: ATP-binding protein [Pyrinomonadaceae bacterium]|nr:ATP-binding protein [Pyrinomonadaceae bacterium]
MAIDKTVILAMQAAVENEPNNIALRLHLAALLMEDGNFEESLRHSQVVLTQEPTNLDALEKAANSAEKLGDLAKADSYRKLSKALKGETERPPIIPHRTTNFEKDEWADILEDEPLKIPQGDGFTEDFFFESERPDLRLEDVAGMEKVKKRLNLAFLAPLKNPEMMKLYGKSLRGGLLLYGPPGCGKTFIARAVAGELGASFITVGLSDVLDMWIGSSEKNIHDLFERARRNAPCVLFFDELDALGRKRSLSRTSNHGAINQLLSELDGVSQQNDGVFVLAATNHPWDVDTALRRPGRLDRTLLVLPPDALAREAVLNFHLRGRPIDGTVDVGAIAKHSNEFSGADLAYLVESAAEFAMEESIETGNVRSIAQNDFKKALREVRSSTRPWFEIAKNYALFANDGGIYDDLLEYLKELRMI